ncbi:MAG TPA: 50S ribosomal protein L35ae [archaeon]|nr:50S ribosomal protein L35ae [archaeon]
MKATILSFRRGRHTQRTNQFLVEAEGVDSREKAVKLVGKKIVWKSPAGKRLICTVTNLHGNKGVLRVRFSKGLPGQALGTKVILEN